MKRVRNPEGGWMDDRVSTEDRAYVRAAAVVLYNLGATNQADRATVIVCSTRDDIVPPIHEDVRDCEPGEVYIREELPTGAAAERVRAITDRLIRAAVAIEPGFYSLIPT